MTPSQVLVIVAGLVGVSLILKLVKGAIKFVITIALLIVLAISFNIVSPDDVSKVKHQITQTTQSK